MLAGAAKDGASGFRLEMDHAEGFQGIRDGATLICMGHVVSPKNNEPKKELPIAGESFEEEGGRSYSLTCFARFALLFWFFK